jgi:hypothetical protein
MPKPKLTEILNNLFKSIGIEQKDADMILAASALKEIELPEDFDAKFSAAYYTPDRAKSELGPKFKTEYWSHFATDIEKFVDPIIETLPDEFKSRAEGLDKTNRVYRKIDLIKEGLGHVKNNQSTDDVKKVTEKFRKEVEDLNKKIIDQDVVLKKKDSDFASRESEIKTDYALRTKILSHKFAPEFEKRKDFIADLTLDSLKKGNFLVEFDQDNSQVMHLRQKKDGAITDVYKGNTQVTLDNYLEEQLSDFTLKSNGGGGNPPNTPKPPTPAPNADQSQDLFSMIRQGQSA